MIWFILRVIGARERTVAGELHRGLGLRTYHPLEVVKVSTRQRQMERSRPLMPGYLFAGCIDGMIPWRDIAATKGVIGWLEIEDKPARITDAEIDRIRMMEREHNRQRDERRSRRVQAGDRVRIVKGAFEGIEVLISEVRGQRVQFDTFGKASSIDLDSVALAQELR